MKIKQFSAFLVTYVDFLEEMAKGEREKYSALISYEPKQVDRVVSRQQAMNMRLTQLEEQREKEQAAAGLEGLTFSEILARLEERDQGELPELFRSFGKAVDEIKYFNEKSIAFVKEGMRLMGMPEEGAPVAPYSHNGRQRREGGIPLFETKI